MKNSKQILIGLAVIAFAATGFVHRFSEDWEVPEQYAEMDNPVEADKASIAEGKALYMLHCRSCHGKEGLGDGPKAAQLKTSSGDFTDEDFQAQSDGALFYKTLKGRDDMPGFEKKIPDADELWSIVNFIRTLE